MKTRGRTANSRKPSSGNQGHDTPPSTSSVELLTTISYPQPLTTTSLPQPLTTTSLPQPYQQRHLMNN
jgi:hypothetical protein